MKSKNILFFSLLITFISCFNTSSLQARDKDTSLRSLSFKERLQFNLGGGLAIGNTITNINVLPQIGYRVTPKFTTGLGANFQYYRNTFFSPDPFMIYGGNVFTRYTINPNIFLQAEYQLLNFRNIWNEYALIGGGYSPGSGFYISAYYLVIYPYNNNIYGAPYVIRAGFMF
jgi:hypothetical protein